MIAVTCTAEDEAEADLWREDHDSADVAGGGGTAMTLGEPALDQTLQVRRCRQGIFALLPRMSAWMLRACSLTRHTAFSANPHMGSVSSPKQA